MVYTEQDADAAISRARASNAERSAILAEAQLQALAEISKQLGALNRAFGKYGTLGELVTKLEALTQLKPK